VNTCQLLSAEVWHVANSKKSAQKLLIKLWKPSWMKAKVLKFTKNHRFHGNGCFSRKMSRPWNRELGWSLMPHLYLFTAVKVNTTCCASQISNHCTDSTIIHNVYYTAHSIFVVKLYAKQRKNH